MKQWGARLFLFSFLAGLIFSFQNCGPTLPLDDGKSSLEQSSSRGRTPASTGDGSGEDESYYTSSTAPPSTTSPSTTTSPTTTTPSTTSPPPPPPPTTAPPPPPAAPEPVDFCFINFGGNIERSFGGQQVAKALCRARFDQFLSNAAFNNLALTCTFGGEDCGMRDPINQQGALGYCVNNFGGNVENSFNGQPVTLSLCQARFNQFFGNSAFNSLHISCRFNGSTICGERGAMQTQ